MLFRRKSVYKVIGLVLLSCMIKETKALNVISIPCKRILRICRPPGLHSGSTNRYCCRRTAEQRGQTLLTDTTS